MRLLLAGDIRAIHLRRYAEYFRERGNQVAIISLEEGPACRPDYKLKTHRLPDFIKYSLAVFSFDKAIRNFQPDLLNCHFVPNYGLLGAMSGFHPLVISAWGSDLLISARKSWLHARRAAGILRHADLILSDALILKSEAERLIAGRKPVLAIPFGIERAILERGRKRLIADKAGLKLISTRRLEKLYRVEDFISAIIRLGKTLDLGTKIVGQGSEMAKLQRACQIPGFPKPAFLGELPHARLLNELLDSDIYISCSESDSTSVSLLEAMACGVFPIVTDIEGNREWIRDGINGLLFPVRDTAALALKIRLAAENFELRKAAIRENFDLIQKQALWEENMGSVEKEFRRLAGLS